MENIIKIDEFKKMIDECKKINKEFITLKITAIESLVNSIKENEVKTQILLSQTYNLVLALKEKGVSKEEIEKILLLKK